MTDEDTKIINRPINNPFTEVEIEHERQQGWELLYKPEVNIAFIPPETSGEIIKYVFKRIKS